MTFFARLTHSLSLRLIAVFLLTAVVLMVLLWVSLDISFERQFTDNIRPYFNNYLISLQEEVGFPPDINTAKAITDHAPVDIIIEAPGYSWSSNGDFIDKPYLDVKLQRMQEENIIAEAGFYKGNFILRTFNQGYVTSFIVTEQLKQTPNMRDFMMIGMMILPIIALLYFVIYCLFKPVHIIERGIKRIGSGEVGYRLRVKRHDELGSLADSINQMADNIEQMLEAKRQLLLAISHELRTPITRAKIALSLLEKDSIGDGIIEDMNEMETLIHELLESERLRNKHTPLDCSVVDVNEIIYQVQGRFFDTSPLVLDLGGDLPMLSLDAKRIGLAIKNIIKNALTAAASDTDKVIVSTMCVADKVQISVTDFGAGIAKADIQHLTEPFYRADISRQRKTGGFGVGLYLIKAIVEAHGGKLVIESELNKGTIVSIYLPIRSTDDTTVAATAKPTNVTDSNKNSKNAKDSHKGNEKILQENNAK